MASAEVATGEDGEHGRARRFSLDGLKLGKKKKGHKGKGKGGPGSARGPPSTRPPSTRKRPSKPGLELGPEKLGKGETFESRDISAKDARALEVNATTWKKALDWTLLLTKDARYMLAGEVLQKLDAYAAGAEGAELKAEMESDASKENIAMLRTRSAEVAGAVAPPQEGGPTWIFAQSMFGMDTYYRYEEGQLYCKVEGNFADCVIFDQLAVIREGNLWNKWGPFVSKSAVLRRWAPTDMALHFTLNMPLLLRDCVVRGYGADYMENNMVVLVADTVDNLDGEPVPPKPSGWTSDRMDVRKFRCVIEAKTPTSGRVVLTAILDPKTNLPPALVNFATKQLVGVLVYLLQEAARKVTSDPNKNAHAKAIREDAHYRTWLLPRVKAYVREKGWAMPRLAALDGFEPATPALTPDGTPVTGGSAHTQHSQQPQTEPSEKKKKKRLKLPSLFKKKKAPEPPAPTGILALLSPARLLSPAKPAPRSARPPPASARNQSPFSRASGTQWVFAVVVCAFLLAKSSVVTSAVSTRMGTVGEVAFLAVLLQAMLLLSNACGFFEPSYASRVFAERGSLSLGACAVVAAMLSFAGSGMGALIAGLRTYKVVVMPKNASSEGMWVEQTSVFSQWWHTVLACALVVLIVRPDLVRKVAR